MDLQKRPRGSQGQLSLRWGIAACQILSLTLGMFQCVFQDASAYTYLATDGGVPVRLSASRTLSLQGRVPPAFENQMRAAVATWAPLAGIVGRLGFFLADPTPSVNFDQQSIVSFASTNLNGRALLGSQVIAATQVWYDTRSGEILESDLVFNDQNFILDSDSRWTTRYFAVGAPALNDGRHVSFMSVLTHEMGHALGLSHSGEIDSTMLPVEGPDQSTLNCDDISGIESLYGQGANGSIVGRILGPTGKPVFGAQVSVVSVANQRIQATGISRQDGRFVVAGLPAGDFVAFVEPFRWGANSLPLFYRSINNQVCELGSVFMLTPLGVGFDAARESQVALSGVTVVAGGQVEMGDTVVVCESALGGAVATGDLSFEAGVAGYVVRSLSSGGSGQLRFPTVSDWNVKALTQSVASRHQVLWDNVVKGGQGTWFQTPHGSMEEDRGGVAEHTNAVAFSWGIAPSSNFSGQLLDSLDPAFVMLAREGVPPARRCSVQGNSSAYRAPGSVDGQLGNLANGAGCATIRSQSTDESNPPTPFQHWGFTFFLELAGVWLVRWKGLGRPRHAERKPRPFAMHARRFVMAASARMGKQLTT